MKLTWRKHQFYAIFYPKKIVRSFIRSTFNTSALHPIVTRHITPMQQAAGDAQRRARLFSVADNRRRRLAVLLRCCWWPRSRAQSRCHPLYARRPGTDSWSDELPALLCKQHYVDSELSTAYLYCQNYRPIVYIHCLIFLLAYGSSG